MDGLFEPEVKGVADKGMPDRHLVKPRHGLVEVLEVFEREVVSGIYPQAEVVSDACSLDIWGDGGGGVGGVKVGIRLGVQLDAVGAGGGGGADVVGVDINKYRCADARVLEALDDGAQEVVIGSHVPAGRGGEGVGAIGHQSHLLGAVASHQFHKSLIGVALNIELHLDDRAQGEDVGAADVALVGARMDGDALCAEGLAVGSHLLHRGTIFASRVAQSRYLIDIYAQMRGWFGLAHF